MCTKVCHTSAKAVRKWHGRKRYGTRIRAYFCKQCKAWHATKSAIRHDKERYQEH